MSTEIELQHGLNTSGHTDLPTDSALYGPSEEEDVQTLASWINIAAASAVIFVGVGFTNTFGVFQEHYQKTLFPHVPADKLIVIGSVASSLYFTLGVVTGRFADLVGYRISLILGTALSTYIFRHHS